MLRGVADAARTFADAELRPLAVRTGEFLFRELVRDDRVMRSYKNGTAKIPGFLEDYAAVALGALALYELTFDRVWLDRARRLADEILARFWDDDAQALFDTASDAESLVTRPRDVTDNASPSGSSLAIEVLLKLGDVLGSGPYSERARYLLETIAEPMARYPSAFGHALGAADLAVRGAIEVAITGDPADERFRALADVVAERYLPSLVLAGGQDADGIALLEGRVRDEPTAYVCRNHACDVPTSDVAILAEQLEAIAGAATAASPTSPR
jgi:uncharacterized protein YyaL (SSP411 family)